MARFRDVLKNKNFLFLWLGQVVSNFGDRLNQMALVALVYQRNPGSEMALAKLDMVGLTPVDADKYPAELSGGMTKRAALARALALDPEIVFLDEPTSGLDPIAAGDFDALIKTLQGTLGLTVYMNTHDLESLYTVCDRIAALADGRIVALGPMETMLECTHPWVQTYFQGKRGGMLTKRIGQLVD